MTSDLSKNNYGLILYYPAVQHKSHLPSSTCFGDNKSSEIKKCLENIYWLEHIVPPPPPYYHSKRSFSSQGQSYRKNWGWQAELPTRHCAVINYTVVTALFYKGFLSHPCGFYPLWITACAVLNSGCSHYCVFISSARLYSHTGFIM